MAVELTENAKQRVRELLAAQPGASWLRLGIKGGGCSGMSYVMDFVPAPTDRDKTFDVGDIHVCVDKKSYLYLNGIVLDYQQDLVRQAFVFENPNAKRSCSCGESFSV